MKKDFDYLVSTFKSSIKTWDYFVNWRKVFDNKAELEISLNKLNYLLGKDDLRSEFYNLYNSTLLFHTYQKVQSSFLHLPLQSCI